MYFNWVGAMFSFLSVTQARVISCLLTAVDENNYNLRDASKSPNEA